MPSKILNTLITDDKTFSVNFKVESYSKEIIPSPILNIWTDLKISIKQEEKIKDFLYYYHKIGRQDSLETLANTYYKTQSLWWLILLANEADDPFDFLENSLTEGDSIKIIKPQFLQSLFKNNTSIDITNYLKGE